MDGEKLTPYCHHFHQAVDVIARRWTPEIVRAMLAGSVRFSEFTAAIPGLSDRLLSKRLKALESEGILTRSVIPETPVRVEYRLTEKGKSLAKAVVAISEWADRWVTVEEVTAPARS